MIPGEIINQNNQLPEMRMFDCHFFCGHPAA
jgi:hypothetical protein